MGMSGSLQPPHGPPTACTVVLRAREVPRGVGGHLGWCSVPWVVVCRLILRVCAPSNKIFHQVDEKCNKANRGCSLHQRQHSRCNGAKTPAPLVQAPLPPRSIVAFNKIFLLPASVGHTYGNL